MPARRAATQLVVLPAARSGARRYAGQLARRGASAAASAAAKAAMAEKHRITAVAAAAVLAIARRNGYELPTVAGLPPAVAYGLAAWAAERFTKSRVAGHVATGLLSVGIYDAIAYTRETREQIDTLVEAQAEESSSSSSTSGLGRMTTVRGEMGG